MNSEETTRDVSARASTAMRDLARATTSIEVPADLSPLIGELLGSVRALVQITDQLAHAHMHHRGRARTDDGDLALGGRDADDATWALVRARELLEAAGGAFDLASHASGQVAWSTADGMDRWVSVVHLQGADADPVLEILERSGAPRAIGHLARWDHGDETTEAALIDGYVYEGIPTCRTDLVAEDRTSGYALIHNRVLGYVSLLRRFPQTGDDVEIEPSSGRASAPAWRSPALPEWAPRRAGASSTTVRSVAL